MDPGCAALLAPAAFADRQPPSSHQVDQQLAAGGKFRAMPSALKFAAFLAINAIIAVVGTAGLDVSISQAIPLHSTVALVWEEYLVSIICAGGLGFAAWRKWRNSAAKWTWALPALWFAFGSLMIAGHGPIFGRLFAPRSQSVLYDDSVRSFFRTFYAFTVPLIRGISYSLGAYFSVLLGSRPSLGIRRKPVVSANVNECL